jgi:hypothetical protein
MTMTAAQVGHSLLQLRGLVALEPRTSRRTMDAMQLSLPYGVAIGKITSKARKDRESEVAYIKKITQKVLTFLTFWLHSRSL